MQMKGILKPEPDKKEKKGKYPEDQMETIHVQINLLTHLLSIT